MARTFMLTVMAGENTGECHTVASSIRIGRDPDNDLIFGSVGVIPHHAVVENRSDHCVLVPAATGKTVLNYDQVTEETILHHGDLISIADNVLGFSKKRGH